MRSIDDKFKEFFADTEKVKELAQDEEFISKVSGGRATAQTYLDEFKKFDLDITKSDAEKICDTADKILSVPLDKLDDEALLNVGGGGNDNWEITPNTAGNMATAGIAAVGGCGAAAMLISGIVYAHKAKVARDAGRGDEVVGASKKAIGLITSAVALAGVTPIAADLGGRGIQENIATKNYKKTHNIN